MKKNYTKLFKRYLLFIILIFVIFWTASIAFKYYKIYSAEKRYFRDYVKMGKYNFNIYKQNASINVAIENLGNRLLNSLFIEIDYYDTNNQQLGRDSADILKMTGNVLFPQTGKIFNITVTCPDKTSEIKLNIK